MHRFFFDFSDAEPDDVGTDCHGLEAAEAEAKCALLNSAAETCSADLAVTIRDQAGRQLSSLSLSITADRPS